MSQRPSPFAPYVVPDLRGLAQLGVPDGAWFARLAGSQLRGHAVAWLRRVGERVPGADGPLRRLVAALEHRLVPEDEVAAGPAGDAEFAWRRIAGVDPFAVVRPATLDEIPAPLRLSDAVLLPLVGRTSAPGAGAGTDELAARVAAGDIYLVDRRELAWRTPADLQPGRFVAATAVLLCHAPELDSRHSLVPLAIAAPRGSAGAPPEVFTPHVGAAWRAAKRMVEVADVHAAELTVHLARAHMMTVPFAVALRRSLPPQHPLVRILGPHLRFDPFLATMAFHQGVAGRTGALVRSLAGAPRWSQDVARTLHDRLSFRDQQLERDLVRRRMADAPIDYPWRDDGRLLHAAIAHLVAELVDDAYASDAALARDPHLRAFVDDVIDRGGIRGLLAGTRLQTRDELVEIATQVLFVAGPLHALAHYGTARRLRHGAAEPAWLPGNPLAPGTAGPDARTTAAQVQRVLGTDIRGDRLGDFTGTALAEHPASAPALAAFARELIAIEAEIQRRNHARPCPAPDLLPSRIPNGITV